MSEKSLRSKTVCKPKPKKSSISRCLDYRGPPGCLGKIYHPKNVFFLIVWNNQMLKWCHFLYVFCNRWFGGRGFWDLHEFHDWPWWKSRVGFNKKMDELSTFLSEHAVTWTWNSIHPLFESYKQLCQLDDERNSLHRKWLFIHFHPFLKWLNLGFQGSCLQFMFFSDLRIFISVIGFQPPDHVHLYWSCGDREGARGSPTRALVTSSAGVFSG